MSERYPPGDNPDYNVLPAGPTVTGRWSGRCPARSQEPRKVAIIAHAGSLGSRTNALAALVAADFSEIEKRVMAQMAVPERLLGKKR